MDKSYLHIYLLYKIKQDCTSDIVDKEFLKERVRRLIRINGGIHRSMVKYIIRDMEKQGLIKCVNHRELYRLNTCCQEKRIKAILNSF
jgi:hypothetical protein